MNCSSRLFALACCITAAVATPVRAAPVVSSLPNGFRIITSDEPGTDRVAVMLMIRAGDADDPPSAPGAARVLGRILLEPANHRSAGWLTFRDIEGDVRVVTEGDVTTFSAVTTRDRARLAVRMLAAFVDAPLWNNTTLIRAVKRSGEEDREDAPTDWQRDFEALLSRLGLDVPSQPLPELPPRDALQSLFESCYRARSMTLAAVGDLRGLDIAATGEECFGALPRTADTVARRRVSRPAPKRRLSDTYAFVGYRAPAATDDMAPALAVISAAMGSGKTSAVFRTLRDIEGTGYESGSTYPRRLVPTAVALFSRAPGQTQYVRNELINIWKNAALDTRTDWNSARTRAVQLYASKHQTARDRAYWLAFWELAGKGAAYDDRYAEAMLHVSDASLRAAARRWLSGTPVAVP